MRRAFRWGLRAKLIVALVGVAILAADLATLYSNRGLESRLHEAATARQTRAAQHFAQLAAAVYGDAGGWTESARTSLRHLALIDGLLVDLRTTEGASVVDTLPEGEQELTTARLSVRGDEGEVLGQLRVGRREGELLTPEEERLQHRLNNLHLAAGATAAAVGLVVALYLGLTLSRPLQRIRESAVRIRAGDLSSRVRVGGDREIRDLGEALNSLAEGLEREEELRKESLADLAHELRTPVMGLLARIEAAQDGVLADEASNLQGMHLEVDRLRRLLDDLTALEEAQRPGLLMQKRRVDLALMAEQVGQEFAPSAAQQGIELHMDLTPAWVEGDGARLEQVLINLLSNAFHYTEAGGTVWLRTATEPHRSILEVRDTGFGIEPEDLQHIFKRFWRGERSRSRDSGGAGIGLAIVHELVKAHGGRVEVRSIPGKGSSFVVVLPPA